MSVKKIGYNYLWKNEYKFYDHEKMEKKNKLSSKSKRQGQKLSHMSELSKKAPLHSFFDPYMSKISLMLPTDFWRVLPPHQLTVGRAIGGLGGSRTHIGGPSVGWFPHTDWPTVLQYDPGRL